MSDENSIKIFSESRNSCLTIRARSEEVIQKQIIDSSVYLSVEVNDEGFSGLNEIGVEIDHLKKFVADLQNCEETRSGSARLLSISPDELDLIIEKSDGWGHFVLRYKISKTAYSRSGLLDKTVTGDFDLDSGLLGEIVSEFADLLPAQ